jgi:hypothetical protein
MIAPMELVGYKGEMTLQDFRVTLSQSEPPVELSAPLAALWWDAKGDWARAHGMVDELSTRDAMAVHAYLHRKEGVERNADYWYSRAGRKFHRPTLDAEWQALVEGLLAMPA